MFQNKQGNSSVTEETAPSEQVFSPTLILCGQNTPICAQYLVNKPEFLLGKADACDAVMRFSDEISREHAKITWRDGAYFLTDLNSTNKTTLNGRVLSPKEPVPLSPGDRIGLSAYVWTVEPIFR